MQISKHLTLDELTKSATAEKMGIQNVPNQRQIDNLKIIANEVFEPMREHFGVPIKVTSGFRIGHLNVAIGGSMTSQHCGGQALDLEATGKIKNADLFNYLINTDFDQLIWEFGDEKEPDWVHVSYVAKGKNRNQSLKAKRVNGKTTYTAFGKKTKK